MFYLGRSKQVILHGTCTSAMSCSFSQIKGYYFWVPILNRNDELLICNFVPSHCLLDRVLFMYLHITGTTQSRNPTWKASWRSRSGHGRRRPSSSSFSSGSGLVPPGGSVPAPEAPEGGQGDCQPGSAGRLRYLCRRVLHRRGRLPQQGGRVKKEEIDTVERREVDHSISGSSLNKWITG